MSQYKLNSRLVDCVWPAFRLARLPISKFNPEHSEFELVSFVRIYRNEKFYLANIRVKEKLSENIKMSFYDLQINIIAKATNMANKIIEEMELPDTLSPFFQLDLWQEEDGILTHKYS